jgi:hypothetical protein
VLLPLLDSAGLTLLFQIGFHHNSKVHPRKERHAHTGQEHPLWREENWFATFYTSPMVHDATSKRPVVVQPFSCRESIQNQGLFTCIHHKHA